MSDEQSDSLGRLEEVTDQIAQSNGAEVQTFHDKPRSTWVASIEPVGDAAGTWVARGDGPTKAKALSELVRNAKKMGIAP